MSDELDRNFFFLEKHADGSFTFLGKTYSKKPPSWLLLSFGKRYLRAVILLFAALYLTARPTSLEENFPLQFNIAMGTIAITIIYLMWKDVKNYNAL